MKEGTFFFELADTVWHVSMQSFIYKNLTVTIVHIPCINFLSWIRGFRDNIANFSKFIFLLILKGDLDAKKQDQLLHFAPKTQTCVRLW